MVKQGSFAGERQQPSTRGDDLYHPDIRGAGSHTDLKYPMAGRQGLLAPQDPSAIVYMPHFHKSIGVLHSTAYTGHLSMETFHCQPLGLASLQLLQGLQERFHVVFRVLHLGAPMKAAACTGVKPLLRKLPSHSPNGSDSTSFVPRAWSVALEVM